LNLKIAKIWGFSAFNHLNYNAKNWMDAEMD
jgi:hypothetical protein